MMASQTGYAERMKKLSKYFASIPVRFADTDANGHVFFANYLTYFDIALLEYFKAVGYGLQRFVDNGLNFLYAEALTRFKSSVSFDDTMNVHVEISNFGNTSFTIEFRIHEQKTDHLINSGHIVAVVVDLESNEPVHVPEELKNAVRKFES